MSQLFLNMQFLRAARHGYTDLCLATLESGASIDARFVDGQAALHGAAWAGSPQLCLDLIDRGADIEAIDTIRQTALHVAASRGHIETCLALIDRGSDLEALDEQGRTALHHAASGGHTQTCWALLDHGAQLEVEDSNNRTPLYLAEWSGHREACLALIAYGADPFNGTADLCSLTQIEAAARGGFIPRLMTLLDATVADHQALADYALVHGQEEAAAAIRSHAARAQIKNIAKGLRHV